MTSNNNLPTPKNRIGRPRGSKYDVDRAKLRKEKGVEHLVWTIGVNEMEIRTWYDTRGREHTYYLSSSEAAALAYQRMQYAYPKGGGFQVNRETLKESLNIHATYTGT